MSTTQKILWPLGAALAGSAFLTGLYFGLVSWAESPQHALDLFWEERLIVIPIILGFGVQMALYTILKKRLFVPIQSAGPSGAITGTSTGAITGTSTGAITGTSGTTSTLAMIACCAHHVTDVLPILGLTAAATFLAKYQTAFMIFGLGTTYVGIAVMVYIIFRERNKAKSHMEMCMEAT